MDAEALSSAAVLAAGRPSPPPAPRSEGGAASPGWLRAPELPARCRPPDPRLSGATRAAHHAQHMLLQLCLHATDTK